MQTVTSGGMGVSQWRVWWLACLMGCLARGSATQAHARTEPLDPVQGQSDGYDEGTTTDKRPFKRGVLQSVTVHRLEPARAKECAGFTVTKTLVSEFIRLAKQISAHDYWHENTWSHCIAKGKFTYKDGRRGYWIIQQYGQGHLTIQGKKYYFLCEACKINGWGAKDPTQSNNRDNPALATSANSVRNSTPMSAL